MKHGLIIGVSLLLPATAWAGAWPGFSNESRALNTASYPFSGPNGDPENPFGNENYYDGDFADLDGDGQPDRVLGARYGMLFNTGGGLMTPFAGRTGFLFRGMPGAPGWGEDAFQTADVDNDGDLDVFSGGNTEPFVLQRNTEGRFATQWLKTGAGTSAILIILTDLENDGDVDLVMGDGGFAYQFSVWVNDGTGEYTEEAVARGLNYNGSGLMGVTSGDLDGDGDFDLIILPAEAFATGPEKIFEVALNDGTGNFTIASTFPFAEAYTDCCTGINTFGQSMNLGDIDDDGDLDLVAARGPWPNQGIHPEVSNSIFINDGSANFVDESNARWIVPGGFDPGSVFAEGKIGGGDGKLVDIDYDGDLDFMSHSKSDGYLSVFLNDGTGTFSFEQMYSESYPPPSDGLGGDADFTDIDGDGDYDAWLGVAGGDVQILLNQHDDGSGLPADVPRNVQAQVVGDSVELSFEAPPFAAVSRFYRVYRATTPSLEDRDRRLIKTIGHPHQDETFFAPITHHTTTQGLGDPDVVLDGATNTIRFTDSSVRPGVSYFYTVSHVGPEQTESVQSDEAVAMVPDDGSDADGPAIDIIAPTDQTWVAFPRIVAHLADPDGVDLTTLSVSVDQDLGDPGNGGRAAGEDLSDLAYRVDGGVVIIPLMPPLELPELSLATVSISVDDMGGASSSADAQMFVATSAAQMPDAQASAAPDMGDAPLEVAFDASGSTDADGKIYRWEWYFGDGTTGIGRQVTHTYAAGGLYTATLLVRDNDGGVAIATYDIDVSGPPPECTLGGSEACYTGPGGTEDVGACMGGTWYCVDGTWGECEGEVVPNDEVCDDGIDNDCDGATDEEDDDCDPTAGTSGLDGTGSGGEAGSGGADGGGSTGGPGADGDGGGGGGCGCTGGSPTRGSVLSLLLLLGLATRRRSAVRR